jgi:hypothetical protein
VPEDIDTHHNIFQAMPQRVPGSTELRSTRW